MVPQANAHHVAAAQFNERFQATHQLSIDYVTELWNQLLLNPVAAERMRKWKPVDLLDALYFMKCCPTAHANAMACGRDEKTLRKWNWEVIETTSSMDWVSASDSNL